MTRVRDHFNVTIWPFRMHQRCIEYTFSIYDNNIIYMSFSLPWAAIIFRIEITLWPLLVSDINQMGIRYKYYYLSVSHPNALRLHYVSQYFVQWPEYVIYFNVTIYDICTFVCMRSMHAYLIITFDVGMNALCQPLFCAEE